MNSLFYDVMLLWKVLELRSNERKRPEEIARIRDAKFRRVLRWALDRCPYYRESFAKRGIAPRHLATIAITDLPTIAKRDVIERFDDLVTTPELSRQEVERFIREEPDPSRLFKGRFQVVHTSGSSGQVVVYCYTLAEMVTAFSCSARMHAFEIGKKNRAAFYGAIHGRFGGVSLVAHGRRGFLRHMYDVCLLDMNLPLAEVIERLNRFQPQILIGYSTGLQILARKQLEGELTVSPRIIENGGERLLPADHELLRKAFPGVPVVNMYAAAECYYLGIGREEYEGIYLMDDFNYIEVLEDHILVTNLFNYTQPLIRYRIDDQVKLKHDTKWLLPFRLAENVVGKVEDPLWFTNEREARDYLHASVFNLSIPGLSRYQIVKTGEREFEFRIIDHGASSLPGLTATVEANVRELLRRKGMSNLRFSVVTSPQVLVDSRTRKFRLMMDASAAEPMAM
jgi:phenylacetate-CoA ligase